MLLDVMIIQVSSRPNWYSTHAVCDKTFFPKIATILVIWKSSDRETPELKSSSSQFTSNFMAPMGPLKIKTGLPNSPICQRALWQIPAFVPDWLFSAKGAVKVLKLFIDITVSKQTSNTTVKMIGK